MANSWNRCIISLSDMYSTHVLTLFVYVDINVIDLKMKTFLSFLYLSHLVA